MISLVGVMASLASLAVFFVERKHFIPESFYKYSKNAMGKDL